MKAKKEQYKQTKNAAINGWKVNLSPPNEEIRQIMPQALALQQKENAGHDCALTKGWHSRPFTNHLTATCLLFGIIIPTCLNELRSWAWEWSSDEQHVNICWSEYFV